MSDDESQLPQAYDAADLRRALQVQDEEIRKLRNLVSGSVAGSLEAKIFRVPAQEQGPQNKA